MPLGYRIQDGDNNDCQEDDRGLSDEVLSRFVKQNFCQNELLDFVLRDFIEYAWSLRSLDRISEFFNGITWHLWGWEVEDVVRRENSLVTGELVYAVIYDVDLDVLAEKGSLIWEEERPKATSHHEAQTGFLL